MKETVVVTAVPPTLLPIPADVIDEEDVLINLYARANPAVVNVTIYGDIQGQVVPLGGGSGFVFDEEGRIITNDHVVNQADQVEVTFADGTILAAEIVGTDPNSDLAVLQVAELPPDVTPLPLGKMDDLAVGQSVVAIGNPFGLEGTLTEGIISAMGRTIPSLTPFSIPQAIQTDAAINPGNSGGPLLNLQGEVVGVNAQIETGGASRANSGVGFAIPVSIVRRVTPELIANGRYPWAWLGVTGGSITPTLVEAMDLPVNNGAYLFEVLDGGPADKARLRGADDDVSVDGRQVPVGGDVVTAVDGRPVRSFDDLLIYIALETRPDQEITLTIIRDGETREVNVRLEARPDSLEA
ncbi:MAG: S1C family serine protease [Anaerolineae bacterium]